MNNFNPYVDIESTNDYENARKDLIKFLSSFDKLADKQKEYLLREIFGIANVATVCDILSKIKR